MAAKKIPGLSLTCNLIIYVHNTSHNRIWKRTHLLVYIRPERKTLFLIAEFSGAESLIK